MPRAYSVDLRERVLNALASGGEAQAEVARRFQVSDWIKQDREEGRRQPKAHGGGLVMLGGDLAALAELTAEYNGLTFAEYATKL